MTLPKTVNVHDGLGGVMTVEEAAEYLQVHPATIQRSLKEGQLPGVRIGRQWRLTKENIDIYLRGNIK